jgi:hypothetical protein
MFVGTETTAMPATTRVVLTTGVLGGFHDVLVVQLRDDESSCRKARFGLALRERRRSR